MKLCTSYFAKHGKHPNAVSIGGRNWWLPNLPAIPELTPPWDLVADYKYHGLSWEDYAKQYVTQLDHLGVGRVEGLLRDGMVLLCWEGPDKHCHRHLLADWLRKLGHDVSELG